MTSRWHCATCGATNPVATRSCVQCGASIVGGRLVPEADNRSSERPLLYGSIVVATVLVTGLGVLVLFTETRVVTKGVVLVGSIGVLMGMGSVTRWMAFGEWSFDYLRTLGTWRQAAIITLPLCAFALMLAIAISTLTSL